jgi:hypothetical protein
MCGFNLTLEDEAIGSNLIVSTLVLSRLVILSLGG